MMFYHIACAKSFWSLRGPHHQPFDHVIHPQPMHHSHGHLPIQARSVEIVKAFSSLSSGCASNSETECCGYDTDNPSSMLFTGFWPQGWCGIIKAALYDTYHGVTRIKSSLEHNGSYIDIPMGAGSANHKRFHRLQAFGARCQARLA
jgi:hypothetical protein